MIKAKDKTKPETQPIILPKTQTFLLCIAISSAFNSAGPFELITFGGFFGSKLVIQEYSWGFDVSKI